MLISECSPCQKLVIKCGQSVYSRYLDPNDLAAIKSPKLKIKNVASQNYDNITVRSAEQHSVLQNLPLLLHCIFSDKCLPKKTSY